MAKILLYIHEDQVAAVTEALAQTKHQLEARTPPTPDGDPQAVANEILAAGAEVVIMGYLDEDAFSVKILQSVTEAEHWPQFVFIDSDPPVGREQIMMAFNEGARSFLPRDFSPNALIHYVERTISGPGRLRFRAREIASDTSLTHHELEEQVSGLRARNKAFQRLIDYLLIAPPTSQARQVLVVSDSLYQRDLLKKYLLEHNFVVSVADNAREGLNIVLQDHPRIVISDLEMEGENGIEFCRNVKLVHKVSPCYFVVCTANQNKVDEVLKLGNEVDDCIIKPGGQDDLSDFIARISLGLLV